MVWTNEYLRHVTIPQHGPSLHLLKELLFSLQVPLVYAIRILSLEIFLMHGINGVASGENSCGINSSYRTNKILNLLMSSCLLLRPPFICSSKPFSQYTSSSLFTIHKVLPNIGTFLIQLTWSPFARSI